MPRIYDPISDVCDAEERAMLSLRRELMKLPPALFAAAVSVASAPALGAPAPIPAGARVEARCKGSPLFYPGKVLRANAVHPRPSPSSPSSSSSPPSSSSIAATAELTEAVCTYAVEFDDGDVDRRVPRAHIHNLYPAPRVRAAAPPTATAVGGGTKRAASQQSPGAVLASEASSVSSPLGPAAAAPAPAAAPSPTAEDRSSPSLPPPPLHGRADLTELSAATVSDLRDILREHREGPQCFCVCRTPTPWRERRLLAKCHGKGDVRGAAKQPCSGRVHPECFGIASYAPGSSSAAAAGDSGAAAGDSGGSAAQGGGMMLGGQPVDEFCCDLCSYLSEGKVLDVIVAVEDAGHSKGNTKGLSATCSFCSGTKGSYQAWVGPFLDPTNGTALGWAHIECALAAAGAGCEAATGRWFNVAEALRAACDASCAIEGCARRPQGLGPGKGASVPCAFDGNGGGCPNRMHLPCCTQVGDKSYCPAHAHASAGSGAKRQKVTDSNS